MKLQTCLLLSFATATQVCATSTRQAPAVAPATNTTAENTLTPMPTTTITKMPGYETTCSAKLSLRCDQYFGAEVDMDKKCCEYDGECGDSGLPLCSHVNCCTGTEEDSSQVVQSKEKACDCAGAVIENKCYKTVQEAMKDSEYNDTVYIGGTKTIEEPIYFSNKLITVAGVMCDGVRAKIVSDFDSKTEAAFEATRWDQTMLFRDLDITGVPGKSSAGIHGLGNENDASNQLVDLTLLNVHIYDLWCQRVGCGIFLGGAKRLYTDEDCVFRNIQLMSSDDSLYAGGAAIGVVYLPEDHTLEIHGTFTDNIASYEEGSIHSGGGAVYLDYVAGDALLDGKFENNTANQGGAVNVQVNHGNLTFDGLYKSNVAIDGGYGARAGAVRVSSLRVNSFTQLKGDFIGNIAQGRGGVLATNSHQASSHMLLDGYFHANAAAEKGGVWNFWSGSTIYRGSTVMHDDATFTENTSGDEGLSNLFFISGYPSAKKSIPKNPSGKLTEAEWNGETTVVYGNFSEVVLLTEDSGLSEKEWFHYSQSLRFGGYLPDVTYEDLVMEERNASAAERYAEKILALEEMYVNKTERAEFLAEIDTSRILDRYENATEIISQRFVEHSEKYDSRLANKTDSIAETYNAAIERSDVRYDNKTSIAMEGYDAKIQAAHDELALNNPEALQAEFEAAQIEIQERFETVTAGNEKRLEESIQKAEINFIDAKESYDNTYSLNEGKAVARYNDRISEAKQKFIADEEKAYTRSDPTEALNTAQAKLDERLQSAEEKKMEELEGYDDTRQERIEVAQEKKDDAIATAQSKYDELKDEPAEKREADLAAAEERYNSRKGQAIEKFDERVEDATAKKDADMAAIEKVREEQLAAAELKKENSTSHYMEETYEPTMSAAQEKFDADLAVAEEKRKTDLAAAQTKLLERLEEAELRKAFMQKNAAVLRENILAGRPSMTNVLQWVQPVSEEEIQELGLVLESNGSTSKSDDTNLESEDAKPESEDNSEPEIIKPERR
ncbi:hypothetical protein SARC_02186 [Sphaeroforma arctica JP610]|uniref:Right handed beta helix domain-containing protein n=1 Tax=Sphaeroforma arctica JP610 TaxID=667725 RepID=A0A0L0GBK1_9EUKA|nr:hypothetical protein SARC_02186 [Sphaeroforma arctica JP610]KNC85613.1 hypothetical protein SARC_02186 [Sphaeroforma arctica JP610]|eukprot:XP_014159515.1 hypothetical protein SARC_02186 [Sphaeroforma arctica JP610]